jgi:ABC-2 type transport system ATP-binding protein
MDKRALQASLAQAPGVLDGLIQGDHIRVVMESNAPPDPVTLLPGASDIGIVQVPPRFEDRFVTLLKVKSGAENVPRSPVVNTTLPDIIHADSDKSVIEVNKLQRRFGNFYAVNNVTFSVGKGEVFGLLGANGAGKSTTFRMLCGLLPPSGGTLRVAGTDLRRAAAVARTRIGYMSQKFSLYGSLSVLENLHFFGSVYGLSGKVAASRISWALKEFELTKMADFTSGDLSLGYKQRLALACALMHEPEILFLDAPTSGVDPRARREFWTRINALAGQGVTVMVTTHFMEEAEYCDRLAIMVSGEILTIGTPSMIKAQACSEGFPEPTMEDAFVGLIKAHEQQGTVA